MAAAVSFTHHPRNPKLWFTVASDLVCSWVILLQRPQWERVFSCASVALRLSGLARLLHFSTCCLTSRSAIADFPERATQFCTRIVNVSARCIVQGPAICELLGGGDHTLTRVLQTVLVFLGPVELLSNLVSHREQHVTLFSFKRHLLHSLLEDLIFLSQSVQGLHGLLVEIVGLGVRLGVLLVCGELRLPFQLFRRRCSSHSFDCVVSTYITSAGTGALTLGASASSIFCTGITSMFVPSLSSVSFSVLGRVMLPTLIPMVVPALIFSRVSAGAPPAPSRITALRSLLLICGWWPPLFVP